MWLSYPVVAPGLVLWARCIFPWKNFRLLYSCCIKWPFSCLVRWLSYIWNIVLLSLPMVSRFYIISFPFQTGYLHFESGQVHGITPIPTYIPTHLNGEANYLSQGSLVPEWHLLPHIAQATFKSEVSWRWICCHPDIPNNVSFITSWNIHYLWVECPQPAEL